MPQTTAQPGPAFEVHAKFTVSTIERKVATFENRAEAEAFALRAEDRYYSVRIVEISS